MTLNDATITNFADFLLDNISRSEAAATMMEEENREAWLVHKSQELAYEHIYHLFEIYFLD